MNVKAIVRKTIPKKNIKAAEELFRRKRSVVLQSAYLRPARQLKVIAVTGTNGKTTTCNYINDILKLGGFKTALYTTAVIEINGVKKLNVTHRTVPPMRQLLSFLKKAKKLKVDYVILETTSHALHQHKLLGIPIHIAVMTNISQDHLDYHGTMEAYTQAKARLFNSYMKPSVSILNSDDNYYDYYAFQAKGRVLTYGQDAASTTRISRIKQSSNGSDFLLAMPNQKIQAHINQVGEFNIYNAAAAATVAHEVGVPVNKIVEALKSLNNVPGRMEMVDLEGASYRVIVDYAHTPDALKSILKAARNGLTGKLWLVFGATGDRDKNKRPIMGEMAVQYADKIVLTDDETYTEQGKDIRRAVMRGIEQASGSSKTIEIANRKNAIKYALEKAKEGDCIILAGIGHQTSRTMNGRSEPWNEVEVVKEIYSKL